MYKSTFSKYLSIISLVVVLGFLAMTLFQVFLTANAMADEKRELLLENADRIASHTATYANVAVAPDGDIVYRLDGARLGPLLMLVSESIDATLLITDARGDVLMAAGTTDNRRFEREVVLDGFVSQIRNEYYTIGTLDGLFESRQHIAAVPVELAGGAVLGYVVACTPANALAQIIRSNLSIYLYSVLGALVLCLAVVWFISDRFVRPLREMAAAARSFAEGDFSPRVKVKGKDEVAQLGEALNGMATSLSSVEMMRRSFIANVSHELKTPIALISSYAEGIKEGISNSPEERDCYCDVIIDEAEKMNLMVKRLATLNQLENNSNELILERFNLTEVIDGFLNRMAIVIEEKQANIYFDNTVPVYVWSDEFLVEEAFMNFFNNALNHMDDDRIIRINAGYLDEKTVRLTVFNTGTGIDEAEQEKIWDKFYKVDKARTRAYGGSGLGLSIVKAIAESLNQRYGVYNVENGVAFWIELEAAECTEEEKKKRRERPSALQKLAELPIWMKTKSAITDRKKKNDGSDKQ